MFKVGFLIAFIVAVVVLCLMYVGGAEGFYLAAAMIVVVVNGIVAVFEWANTWRCNDED